MLKKRGEKNQKIRGKKKSEGFFLPAAEICRFILSARVSEPETGLRPFWGSTKRKPSEKAKSSLLYLLSFIYCIQFAINCFLVSLNRVHLKIFAKSKAAQANGAILVWDITLWLVIFWRRKKKKRRGKQPLKNCHKTGGVWLVFPRFLKNPDVLIRFRINVRHFRQNLLGAHELPIFVTSHFAFIDLFIFFDSV